MHRWSSLVAAFRPAAQWRALVEGWPPLVVEAGAPRHSRGRRIAPPIRFVRVPHTLQEVRP